jgi:hypothetical protein
MPATNKPRSVNMNLRIPAAIDKKLIDLQEQTGMKRTHLVHLILYLVDRDALATLLARDPHAGAQRPLASVKDGQRRDHRSGERGWRP